MLERQSRGKRLVFVPEELLERLMEASSMEGKPFIKYVEEALWQAVKAYEMGHSLKEIVRFFEIIQAQRASGAIFTPLGVFNYLTSKVYAAEKEQLQVAWYESGKWYGKYLTEKFEDPIQALAELLQATRWDLNEVKAKKAENTVKFTCISTTLTDEGTELLASFIEGAMHSIEYKTIKNEHMRGIILLEFARAQT